MFSSFCFFEFSIFRFCKISSDVDSDFLCSPTGSDATIFSNPKLKAKKIETVGEKISRLEETIKQNDTDKENLKMENAQLQIKLRKIELELENEKSKPQQNKDADVSVIKKTLVKQLEDECIALKQQCIPSTKNLQTKQYYFFKDFISRKLNLVLLSRW